MGVSGLGAEGANRGIKSFLGSRLPQLIASAKPSVSAGGSGTAFLAAIQRVLIGARQLLIMFVLVTVRQLICSVLHHTRYYNT